MYKTNLNERWEFTYLRCFEWGELGESVELHFEKLNYESCYLDQESWNISNFRPKTIEKAFCRFFNPTISFTTVLNCFKYTWKLKSSKSMQNIVQNVRNKLSLVLKITRKCQHKFFCFLFPIFLFKNSE